MIFTYTCVGRPGNNSILGTVAAHPVYGSVRGLRLFLIFQTSVALASQGHGTVHSILYKYTYKA